MIKILIGLISIICLYIQPVLADSIEYGQGCPSGKCPGSAYEKLGYKINPDGTVTCFCNPNGACHLRDLESKGIPTGVKNWGKEHCISGCDSRIVLVGVKKLGIGISGIHRTVWYKGQHLCDPKDPNRCKPLPMLNEKAKASPIYKHAHGESTILFGNCWLYQTPNDCDRGHKPPGSGTRIGGF